MKNVIRRNKVTVSQDKKVLLTRTILSLSTFQKLPRQTFLSFLVQLSHNFILERD